MSATKTRSRGVSGSATALPDQGALLSAETVKQSCPTASGSNSTQLRIRLPAKHAARWTAMPPRLREHVAGIVFGSFTEGVRLDELAAVGSELRLARLALTNALQLALVRGASFDAKRVEAAVAKIDRLLGGLRP